MSAPLLSVEKVEVVYHRADHRGAGNQPVRSRRADLAILGTNGAGKTTTLRAISGFLGIDNADVTEGAIYFKGARIENRPPNQVARLGMALVPEREKVFPNLTVAENLAAPFAPTLVARRAASARGTGLSVLSPARRSAGSHRRAACRVASDKCWRSAVR